MDFYWMIFCKPGFPFSSLFLSFRMQDILHGFLILRFFATHQFWWYRFERSPLYARTWIHPTHHYKVEPHLLLAFPKDRLMIVLQTFQMINGFLNNDWMSVDSALASILVSATVAYPLDGLLLHIFLRKVFISSES
jgi:hypothetical protein